MQPLTKACLLQIELEGLGILSGSGWKVKGKAGRDRVTARNPNDAGAKSSGVCVSGTTKSEMTGTTGASAGVFGLPKMPAAWRAALRLTLNPSHGYDHTLNGRDLQCVPLSQPGLLVG
jgi:hypothetical protein